MLRGRNLINVIGHKSPIAADKHKCEKKNLNTNMSVALAWNLAQKKTEEIIKYHKIQIGTSLFYSMKER